VPWRASTPQSVPAVGSSPPVLDSVNALTTRSGGAVVQRDRGTRLTSYHHIRRSAGPRPRGPNKSSTSRVHDDLECGGLARSWICPTSREARARRLTILRAGDDIGAAMPQFARNFGGTNGRAIAAQQFQDHGVPGFRGCARPPAYVLRCARDTKLAVTPRSISREPGFKGLAGGSELRRQAGRQTDSANQIVFSVRDGARIDSAIHETSNYDMTKA
jgi:hypothetical protein